MPISSDNLQDIIERASPEQLRILMGGITAPPNQKINLTNVNNRPAAMEQARVGLDVKLFNTLKELGLADGDPNDGSATIHPSLGTLKTQTVNNDNIIGTVFSIEPQISTTPGVGTGPYDVITAVGFSKIWNSDYDNYQKELDSKKSLGLVQEIEVTEKLKDKDGNYTGETTRKFVLLEKDPEATKKNQIETEKAAKEGNGGYLAQDQWKLYPEYEPILYEDIPSNNLNADASAVAMVNLVLGISVGRNILTENAKTGAIQNFVLGNLNSIASSTEENKVQDTYKAIRKINKTIGKIASFDAKVGNILQKFSDIWEIGTKEPDKKIIVGPLGKFIGLTEDMADGLKKTINTVGQFYGGVEILNGILDNDKVKIARGVQNVSKIYIEIYLIKTIIEKKILQGSTEAILDFLERKLIGRGFSEVAVTELFKKISKGGSLIWAIAEITSAALGQAASEAKEREKLKNEAELLSANESIYLISGGSWITDPPVSGTETEIDPNTGLPIAVLPDSWTIIDHNGNKVKIPIPGQAYISNPTEVRTNINWKSIRTSDKWWENALTAYTYTPAYWILLGIDKGGSWLSEQIGSGVSELLSWLGIIDDDSEDDTKISDYRVPFIFIHDTNYGTGVSTLSPNPEDLTDEEYEKLNSTFVTDKNGNTISLYDRYYIRDPKGDQPRWFTKTTPAQNIAVEAFIEKDVLPLITTRKQEWINSLSQGRTPTGSTSPEFFANPGGDFYEWWEKTYPNDNWLNYDTFRKKIRDIQQKVLKEEMLKQISPQLDSMMDIQLDTIRAQEEYQKSKNTLDEITSLVNQQIINGNSNVPPIDLNQINENVSFALNVDNKFYFSPTDLKNFSNIVTPLSTPTCLSENTLIKTAHGDIKISELKVGDSVISFDKVGNLIDDVIVDTHKYSQKILYKYVLENNLFLEATNEHPVLTIHNTFIEIGQLNIGDCLIDSNGNALKIIEKNCVGKSDVYNITVLHNETYIANGIRVHNKPGVPYRPQDILGVYGNMRQIISELDDITEKQKEFMSEFEKRWRDFSKRQSKEVEPSKPPTGTSGTSGTSGTTTPPIAIVTPTGGPPPSGTVVSNTESFPPDWIYKNSSVADTPIIFDETLVSG